MNLLFKLIIGIILVAILLITGCAVILLFENSDIKTMGFSNAGAVSLIALASVSFSWAIALKSTPYKKHSPRLNRVGQHCVISAILFILCSLTQYCSDGIKDTVGYRNLPKMGVIFERTFHYASNCFAVGALVLSFYAVYIIILTYTFSNDLFIKEK